MQITSATFLPKTQPFPISSHDPAYIDNYKLVDYFVARIDSNLFHSQVVKIKSVLKMPFGH
jgi:hypothetical protein